MNETAVLELDGMPQPARLRRYVADGMCVVEYGPQVLFCFKVSDKGMRNVAVVAVTDAKVAVKEAATVFGLTPEYVSELRGRARKEGSAGLVKAMGRPPMLSARQVAKVRELAGQGATQTALANRFKVCRPVIADVLARHGVIAAQPPLAGDPPDGAGPARVMASVA